MVLVPSDEDYKARCKAQEDAGCKDIPDDAIMEMKGNSKAKKDLYMVGMEMNLVGSKESIQRWPV